METELKYRIITKKSAEQLSKEEIDVRYFQIRNSKESEDRLKISGRGRNYTEAFDNLMKRLEKYNKAVYSRSKLIFGLCNIREITNNIPEIILRGDLVST